MFEILISPIKLFCAFCKGSGKHCYYTTQPTYHGAIGSNYEVICENCNGNGYTEMIISPTIITDSTKMEK